VNADLLNLAFRKSENSGGEGGIRTLSAPVESVTYRFQLAGVAVDASDAAGPCSILPDGRPQVLVGHTPTIREQVRVVVTQRRKGAGDRKTTSNAEPS
jgi:hypothetical protein